MASEVRSGKDGIDLLKSRIGQPVQPNKFVVEFTKLPGPFAGMGAENLTILCKGASLPGKSIATSEHMRHRYIPNGEVDYGNTLELTYLCDANFMDRMIIEAWQSFVHTADVSTRTKFENGRDAQVFRFYEEYTGQCLIHVLRKDGTPSLTYVIEECFPVEIAAQDLSMETTDQILEFTFTLNYRHWHSEYNAMDTSVNMNQPMDGNFSVSGLNKGRKIFDAVLEGLKVAGRFNSKLGDLGRKLGSYDTAITRASNIGRDLGIGSEYITDKRRGGS